MTRTGLARRRPALIAALCGILSASSLNAADSFTLRATFQNPGNITQTLFGLTTAMSADGFTVASGYMEDPGGILPQAVTGNPPSSAVGVVYVRPPRLGWSAKPLPTAWLVTGETILGGLGVAVSSDGSTIAVYAARGTNLSTTLFVFTRPSGGWSGQVGPAATLTASDTSDRTALFGANVAIGADGSLVLVGLPGRRTALVFARPPHGWSGTLSPSASLSSPPGSPSENFGSSAVISADGSWAAIGSGQVPNSQPSSPASIYLFQRPTAGWVGAPAAAATLLDPADVSPGSIDFSNTIDAAGSIIAATFVSDDLASVEGLVFVRPEAGWSGEIHPSARLTLSGAAPVRAAVSSDGTAIAFVEAVYQVSSGKNVLVGSSLAVYRKPANGWSDSSMPEAVLGIPGTLAGGSGGSATTGSIGWSISGNHDGDRWLAGALFDLKGGGAQPVPAGAAFVWETPHEGRTVIPAIPSPAADVTRR